MEKSNLFNWFSTIFPIQTSIKKLLMSRICASPKLFLHQIHVNFVTKLIHNLHVDGAIRWHNRQDLIPRLETHYSPRSYFFPPFNIKLNKELSFWPNESQNDIFLPTDNLKRNWLNFLLTNWLGVSVVRKLQIHFIKKAKIL